MSPKNKKKLDIIRKKLDQIPNAASQYNIEKAY